MSDFLVNLGANPNARKLITTLGLPIPLPKKLRRGKGPWEAMPIKGREVFVGAFARGELGAAIADTLAEAGAKPILDGANPKPELYEAPGEAWGRPATLLGAGEIPEKGRFHALVFDASGMSEPGDLNALHEFFHPRIKRLAPCGRVIVLGRPAESISAPPAAAAAAGLEGFVRSVAKEVGRKGATANLLRVQSGAEDRVPPVLRFLLSDRPAFVSGQPWTVTKTARKGEDAKWVRPMEGKTVLVTGAARGIGRATARRLAEEGAHVVCLDRPEDDGPCSKVAHEVGGSVLLCDVSAEDAPMTIANHLKERFDGVDAVIHNAGVTRDKTLGNMDAARWEMAIDVNLVAIQKITEAILEVAMGPGGRLVLLSSVAGLAGNFGQTNYAASKAGVAAYAKALAAKLARRGITVNAVAPGFIETRMTATIPTMTREGARRLSNVGQGGLPVDVAEVLTFLATPNSGGLTGQVLRVCGGALIGA
jgi:3-oxoacyl-[acyl-carrier protein] reductase